MFEKLKHGVGRLLGYDAVEDVGKRKQRRISVKSEDRELDPNSYRRQMVSSARDLVRNSCAANWAVKKHVSAVCDLTFHSRTGNPDLDKRIEELYHWWADRPQNCDVACRHSLSEIYHLLEERAVVDGDCGLLKLADGRIQAIEGDRISDAAIAPNDNSRQSKLFYNGVQVDEAGRPIAYRVCKRRFDSLEWERDVPAWQLLLHSYATRFDQLRGITPLAPALNTFADAYEATNFTLAKMKQSALFGLSIFREGSGDLGEDADSGYNIDLSKGPFVADMEPGDRMEWLESKSPSSEFAAFYKTVISLALKSLMIPACDFNDGDSNYSEERSKKQDWFVFVESRRNVLRQILNNLVAWRLGLFVQDKVLILPKGWTLDHLKWEFVGAGLPWLNPVDEVKAATAAIAAGITSPQRVCKQLGEDAGEILAEIAQWNIDRQALGVPAPLYGVVGTQEEPIPNPDRVLYLD